jgi:hypothetical protein
MHCLALRGPGLLHPATHLPGKRCGIRIKSKKVPMGIRIYPFCIKDLGCILFMPAIDRSTRLFNQSDKTSCL